MGVAKGEIVINTNDIINRRSGRLKVICYAGRRYDVSKGVEKVRHFYLCQCECGRFCIVRRGQILNHKTRSCGCLKRKYKQ